MSGHSHGVATGGRSAFVSPSRDWRDKTSNERTMNLTAKLSISTAWASDYGKHTEVMYANVPQFIKHKKFLQIIAV